MPLLSLSDEQARWLINHFENEVTPDTENFWLMENVKDLENQIEEEEVDA